MTNDRRSNDPAADVRTLARAVIDLLKIKPSEQKLVEKLEYTMRVVDDTTKTMAPRFVQNPSLQQLLGKVYQTKSLADEFNERDLDPRVNFRAVCDRHIAFYQVINAIARIRDGFGEENQFTAISDIVARDFLDRSKIENSPFSAKFKRLADSVASLRMPATLREFVSTSLVSLESSTKSEQDIAAALNSAWEALQEHHPDVKKMRFYADLNRQISSGTNDAKALVGEVKRTLLDSATYVESHSKPSGLLDAYLEDVKRGAKPEDLTELAPNVAVAVRHLYSERMLGDLYQYLDSNERSIVRTLDAHAVAEQKRGQS